MLHRRYSRAIRKTAVLPTLILFLPDSIDPTIVFVTARSGSLDADSRATIVDLCAASDKGAYIDVTDSSDQLQAAFATVAAMITQDVALEDF
jgi:hypothetical protein